MCWKQITTRKNTLLLISVVIIYTAVTCILNHNLFLISSGHLGLKKQHPHNASSIPWLSSSKRGESSQQADHHAKDLDISLDMNSSDQPLCIEKNVCKENITDKYYIHKRLPDFIEQIDSGIRYDIDILHTDYVVPNIVHFVQFSDINYFGNRSRNDFKFHHMLSVLSAYKHQKPDRIYFWLDKEPESEYWQRLKRMVPMYLIIRERPTSIRGRRVHYITKVSNVIRMEALIEYGGMYFDLDVIVVKSFNNLRKYDATMGKEGRHQFCNAVLVAKPWSDFLRIWHQEHVSLNESVWSYHSGKVPYLLSQKHPSLVHVEERSFFRPSYFEIEYLYNDGLLYDWRNSHYCVHLWISLLSPKRRKTDSEIDTWNTTAGELFRFILYDDWRLRQM